MQEEKFVSNEFLHYYKQCFNKYGATPKGISWPDKLDNEIRYAKMINVVDQLYKITNLSLLDVGCGYGGLLDYMIDNSINIKYIGLDLVPESITYAREKHHETQFHIMDALDMDYDECFDYVVNNGIFTLKNDVSNIHMDKFVRTLIKKMFKAARVGIAFNMFSTHVNFFSNKNFYKNPLETLAFCLSELSNNIKIDHSYKLFEYTVYVYK